MVAINGQKSKAGVVLYGAHEGSVLRPILFLIYITDLLEHAETIVKLFADDSKAYSIINILDDHRKSWSKQWELDFNAKKCKLLRIGKNDPDNTYKITDESNQSVAISNVTED